ncbi:DNA-binding transcriptional regulator, Lrp family [Haladaptatus litoreus]|uniref:DNA-binding transcriptional regulator, Lrp family n=1 Tax=Haladaptatus litoreus TaxID=553468 RepID=A0A1N7CYA0_9EURY|nr:AsnC family transcriptional regulator [Haladaptatus litoreus]SIR68549.1 DNA-binding transcriptional regulator, Lrp family [Haladaptatus litoreus]
MSELDSTDIEILQLLLEDARRPYREIADVVNLSPPSVSNRVERLQDLGIVRRFTVEMDQTQLSRADELLLVLDVQASKAADIRSQLVAIAGVEHVFQTVESRIIAKVILDTSEVHELFTDTLDEAAIEDYEVESVLHSSWQPALRSGDIGIQCSICGNQISGDGETVEVDSGDMYHVCCSSCAEEIVEQYESLQEAANE